MRALTLTTAATSVPPPADDAALVCALAHNDERAFAEIYDRYWEPLLQQALRKLGRREDAEEIVQELFVALWNNRNGARIQHLESYLFSALKYRAIDAIRAQLVRKTYAATRPASPAPQRCTEEAVAAADLSQALSASLCRLPASAREVFRLSRQEHQSVPEIAARLRLSPKTVEYHLSRSLSFLRRYLREFLAGAVLALIPGALKSLAPQPILFAENGQTAVFSANRSAG